VRSLKIVAQMLNPYILLVCWYVVGDINYDICKDKSRRGEALPPPFTLIAASPNGNAIAQTPQRRDNLSMKAKRVKHLRTEMFCEEFEYCGANALPLQNICVDGDRNFELPIKNLVGAKHYRHHLRLSLQSSNGNASPKPHNAGTIYR
jgi:hypothetical protein